MQITVRYPESWAEIKYKNYMQYYNAVKPYQGTEEESKKVFELGALHFCNVPAEYLYKLPVEAFDKMTNSLFKLFKESKKLPLVNQFEIYGVKYGFVPNLDDISYGEYLDLVNYTSKDLYENVPITLSILYRPIKYELGKNYTIQPYTGTNDTTIEMFSESLTMDVVFGSIAFFLNLYQDLMIGTLHYSKQILKEKGETEILAQLETLEKSGIDITQLPSLLKTISLNLI